MDRGHRLPAGGADLHHRPGPLKRVAVWFNGSGALRGRLANGALVKSVHGERKIMIGFNDAQIRADLAGATPRKVELHMLSTHSWATDAGVDVHFGAHKRTAPPSSFSAVRSDAWTGHWPRSGDAGTLDSKTGLRWQVIALGFGAWFREDICQGLTVDQPTSDIYYGQIDWKSIQLRISATR